MELLVPQSLVCVIVVVARLGNRLAHNPRRRRRRQRFKEEFKLASRGLEVFVPWAFAPALARVIVAVERWRNALANNRQWRRRLK